MPLRWINLLLLYLFYLITVIHCINANNNQVYNYANYLSFMENVTGNANDLLVIGGKEVARGKYNYTVGLRSTPSGRSFCGGSLISPKHVITAGHCMSSINYAVIGGRYLDGVFDGETIRIVKQIRHDGFGKPFDMSNDFAILELEKPSKMTPILLGKRKNSKTLIGKFANTHGWGTTTFGGIQSPILLSVSVMIWSKKDCKKKVKEVDHTMICAGGKLNRDTCQNDSGGPLSYIMEDGKEVLVGIVSWGIGCGGDLLPGVYSRVSSARRFINKWSSGHQWVTLE